MTLFLLMTKTRSAIRIFWVEPSLEFDNKMIPAKSKGYQTHKIPCLCSWLYREFLNWEVKTHYNQWNKLEVYFIDMIPVCAIIKSLVLKSFSKVWELELMRTIPHFLSRNTGCSVLSKAEYTTTISDIWLISNRNPHGCYNVHVLLSWALTWAWCTKTATDDNWIAGL